MATGEGRSSGWRVALTVVLALLFSLVPLPAVVAPYRPNLLLLLIIYWALRAPAVAGLLFAWLCGLAVDLLTGTLLGQHAVAFLAIAFITHKQQLRMRVFPIYHQTFTVFAFLALYEFLIWWIDGIIGLEVNNWQRWMSVVSGAVFWPIIVAVLDTWNRRRW